MSQYQIIPIEEGSTHQQERPPTSRGLLLLPHQNELLREAHTLIGIRMRRAYKILEHHLGDWIHAHSSFSYINYCPTASVTTVESRASESQIDGLESEHLSNESTIEYHVTIHTSLLSLPRVIITVRSLLFTRYFLINSFIQTCLFI